MNRRGGQSADDQSADGLSDDAGQDGLGVVSEAGAVDEGEGGGARGPGDGVGDARADVIGDRPLSERGVGNLEPCIGHGADAAGHARHGHVAPGEPVLETHGDGHALGHDIGHGPGDARADVLVDGQLADEIAQFAADALGDPGREGGDADALPVEAVLGAGGDEEALAGDGAGGAGDGDDDGDDLTDDAAASDPCSKLYALPQTRRQEGRIDRKRQGRRRIFSELRSQTIGKKPPYRRPRRGNCFSRI